MYVCVQYCSDASLQSSASTWYVTHKGNLEYSSNTRFSILLINNLLVSAVAQYTIRSWVDCKHPSIWLWVLLNTPFVREPHQEHLFIASNPTIVSTSNICKGQLTHICSVLHTVQCQSILSHILKRMLQPISFLLRKPYTYRIRMYITYKVITWLLITHMN